MEEKTCAFRRGGGVILRGCLIAFAALFLSGCSSVMDWYFKRSVDPPTGEIAIPGLKEPVTVRRDAYGIPFVDAKNMEDMAMAVGYLHASDRLSQMISYKLMSEGRLAEMAGPAVLDLDYYMRAMNLKAVAAELYRRVSPENLRLLKKYSEGVNAYLETHQNKLPATFVLAHYKPERWEAMDSVKIFALVNFGLSFNLHEELAALNIAQKVGAKNAAWLLPIYPDEPIAFDEAAKLEGLDLNRAAAAVAVLADLHPVLEKIGLTGFAASNNWAIHKSRTQHDASILANDMHLPLSLPSTWNLAHVRCGDYDVAGVSLAGAPIIVAGYNRHIAWGMTMVMDDNQDLFLEQLKTIDGKWHYLYKSRWLPVVEREEIFKIKGEKPVTRKIRETVHGVLLNEAVKNQPLHYLQGESVDVSYGIALSSTAVAPDDDSMNAFFQLSFAHSVDEALPIIRKIKAIPLNMVFADRDNIAWQVIGNYPVRSKGRGFLPSPGWNGEYDWKGLLPQDALPYLKNPSSGFVATANHRTIPKDYPYILSSSWYWPERAERIEQMISATDKHTAQTNMDMQLDVYSLFVPKLKSAIFQGKMFTDIEREISNWTDESRKEKARLAVKMLRDFDGRLHRDSKEAAVFGAFMNSVTVNTFFDELGPAESRAWQSFLAVNNQSYNATCDHLTVRGDESPFWDDIRTPKKETKSEIIAKSLADAVLYLEKNLGPSPDQWSWGKLHTYTWETDTSQLSRHFSVIERAALKRMWKYFNRGPYPAPGDFSTLNVSAYMMGKDFDTWLIPSMRMIVDFSREEPMLAVNSSGQSDNPSSPHYDDGITAWREGKYLPFPFQEAAIQARYTDVMRLVPSR
jgi:acyl-homoserine-lactone acylase